MAYGLRIRNSAGEIQIDDRWATLRFRERGSLSITSNGNSTGYATLSDPPTPRDAPLFAVRSTAMHMVAHTPIANVTSLSSIDLDEPLTELRVCKWSGSGTAHSVDWICVDAQPAPANADTYGLVVRDADGNVTFDSRQKLVLVRDVIMVGTVAGTSPRTFSHATCRGTAYYASGLRQAFSGVVGIEPVLYAKALTASSVEVNMLGQNQTGWDPPTVPLIVLDVFD